MHQDCLGYPNAYGGFRRAANAQLAIELQTNSHAQQLIAESSDLFKSSRVWWLGTESTAMLELREFGKAQFTIPLRGGSCKTLAVNQPALPGATSALESICRAARNKWLHAGPHTPGLDGVSEPTPIESTQIQPTYPPNAKTEGLPCKVVLQIVVNEQGQVTDATVFKSTIPSQGFEETAIDAVLQWRYHPASKPTKDGPPKPVSVFLTAVLNFEAPPSP